MAGSISCSLASGCRSPRSATRNGGKLEKHGAAGSREKPRMVESHRCGRLQPRRPDRLHPREPRLNTRFPASEREPVTMHVKDFDKNGFSEQIVSRYSAGRQLSDGAARRSDQDTAVPEIAVSKLQGLRAANDDRHLPGEGAGRRHGQEGAHVRHDDGEERRQRRVHARAVPVRGAGRLQCTEFSPAITIGMARSNVLLAGNFDGVKPEIGRMHAGYGVFLRGDGKGGFVARRSVESGFFVPGQARDIQRVRTRQGELYVVTRNNDRPLVFRATPRVALHASSKERTRTAARASTGAVAASG